ncbi:Dabb family protein [Erwinia amylovora]|uniref:Dabb family protein n=1 Tax=Erwinia amylovora TaxID=552 RepID=UPI000C07649F|nr:Dabb family protein [Erwinia amylovora]MBZ2398691.1 Dabb family protein [Erwinia amylovora]MBZ2402152.1 Dabb family protein [Erwinia amylovora]
MILRKQHEEKATPVLMHIVLFTLKKELDWTSEEVIDAERATHAHPNFIDEIKGWACGRNTTQREIAADFMVMGLFESRDDLNAYLIHPDHQAGVKKWQAIADWKVVDIELNSHSTLNRGLLARLNALTAVC